jgi:glucose-6-phosphate 1-dehydrogenase
MTDPATLTGTQLEPAILVIFGITGDLAKRKVLPALYHLLKDNLLPEHLAIVGTSRRSLSVDELLKNVELCVLEKDNVCDPTVLELFRQRLHMLQFDPVNGADYDRLHAQLDQIETEQGVCMNRLYYLSIPPQVYGPLVRQLGEHGLNQSCQHNRAATRLLVEKPFGYDLSSAEELVQNTAKQFSELQVFRIDHYLAKETAQNILTFRRYNPLFSSVWSNQYIERIDIIAAEQIGIEGRAEFYEQIGAMRDLIQSHLMQLLALTTMELPSDLTDSDAIHQAKQALLESIPPLVPNQVANKVVRGQYDSYRQEVNNPDSTTETYVSIELSIANERWQAVPVTLTTGKALRAKRTEVTIRFGDAKGTSAPNQLTFRVQPNEGIDVQLIVKKPGFEAAVQPASMDFSYQATFDENGHPEAYERVLVDAVRGDHTLFATSAEVLASWRILQPILNEWQKNTSDLHIYTTGSEGPESKVS